jgi:hypothetical protein
MLILILMGAAFRAAIFNRCPAAHWCYAKGPQVCRGSLGGRSKGSEKKWRNKKITLHHRADYFIQNLIFHYFVEKKRGCVAKREGRGGTLFEANGIRYRIFFINDNFFNDISFQYLE